MKNSRVAAIQMVSGNNLNLNLAAVKRLVTSAAQAGAGLVVLPETFAMFSAKGQYSLGVQEVSNAAVVRPFIAALAKDLGIWIVAGSIPMADGKANDDRDNNKVYSASLVFNTQGQEVARYNKMHLFDVDVADQQGSYRESDTFLFGDQVVVVDTPFGRLGLSVCYDLRFPEFYRAMFAQSVDIIAVPAAFTLLTGQAHWLTLLRARAIENQCYVIGANQGGEHSAKRSTSGGSVIIDGWGTVLADMAMGEGYVAADINLEALSEWRRAMPIHQQQRFNVVKN
ncbi:carbon-nitrogen hydrolase family protein [Oceanicoccus sp. KOV_DT_Chl]|uniref:carbon-nitrogen hydrolase family protein n=1 Tax=Oceanicoccus sp. KOV_DT_Chl TaxID=1904639 RepID=UPI000C7D8CD8|nr:carbon-nitrogen hydrolase family protein [Oceanicoccus sp. KOV_DT_Chl]